MNDSQQGRGQREAAALVLAAIAAMDDYARLQRARDAEQARPVQWEGKAGPPDYVYHYSFYNVPQTGLETEVSDGA